MEAANALAYYNTAIIEEYILDTIVRDQLP
jgi:hypothetical protein